MRLIDLGPATASVATDAPPEASWAYLLREEWIKEYRRSTRGIEDNEESEATERAQLFRVYNLRSSGDRDELRTRYSVAIRRIDEVVVKFGDLLKSSFNLEDLL